MNKIENSLEKRKRKTPLRVTVGIASVMVVVLYVYLFHVVPYRKRQIHFYNTVCRSNLDSLGRALVVYASQHSNEYPTAEEWCDLLAEGDYAGDKQFVCMVAKMSGYQGRSHYAMNPDCGANSSADTVLLFETKGGWNQHGGPEILATENHKRKGCNILFNNGHVEFVPSSELSQLKWKAETGTK